MLLASEDIKQKQNERTNVVSSTVCPTWVSAEMVSSYFYGHRPGVALGIDRTQKIHFQINRLFLVAL